MSVKLSSAVYTSGHEEINKGVRATVRTYLNRFGVGGFLLLLIAYGLVAAPAGLSADSDSALLMRATEHWINVGEYTRSRTSGFPLYEALLLACKSISSSLLLINLLSLLMAAGAAMLARQMAAEKDEWRGNLTLALLLTYPLFMIASAEPMETMLSVLLALGLIQHVVRHPQFGWSHIGLAVLLVLARLDAALLVIAIVLARLGGQSSIDRFQSLLWLAKVGALSVLAYVAINQGFDFLNTKTMGFDTWMRRVARGIASSVNALQLSGLMALIIWLRHLAKMRAGSVSLELWDRLLIWAILLYSIRFFALPDEVFYLIIPVTLLLIRAAMLVQPTTIVVAAFVLLGCVQSGMTVSLFERIPNTQDRIIFSPKLSASPLVQELRARRVFTQLRDDVDRKPVECYLFSDCPELLISHTAPYLHTVDNKRAAVSAKYLYVFFSGRYPRLIDKGFEEIRVCDEEVVPGPAWRIWQPSVQHYLVDVLAKKQKTSCRTLRLSGQKATWHQFN